MSLNGQMFVYGEAAMPIPLPIECERLSVRPFVSDADSDSMLGVYGDPEVMRFIPGGALPDIEAVRALLDSYTTAQQVQGFSSWAIVERQSGQLIGDVGFGIFQPTGDIELGYTLATEFWGNGYAIEAAGACLAAALTHLAASRIIAVVDEANAPSRRVAERLGMRKVEAIQAHGRPHLLFASQ